MQVIRTINNKHPSAGIGIVSVNGMQITGKSYILNQLVSLMSGKEHTQQF